MKAAEISRKVQWKRGDLDEIIDREWLVANGLGGFASGTISGVLTRRYHGLLVSALPSPLGRVVMLSSLFEQIILPNGSTAELGGIERRNRDAHVPGAEYLTTFQLAAGLPEWRYSIGSYELEKKILLPHLQNTVYIQYRILRGEGPLVIRLSPFFHLRPIEKNVTKYPPERYSVEVVGTHYQVRSGSELPDLKIILHGSFGSFILMGGEFKDVYYRMEENRGYPAQGKVWVPGYFQVTVTKETSAALVASTESWEVIHALSPSQAFRSEVYRRQQLLDSVPSSAKVQTASELVLAADQFVIAPITRTMDVARTRAMGDEVRSIIAGYHWFTDWGRDTMISLEGLTLTTGRPAEAGYILRTFGHYVHEGLIPNLFPEGEETGVYHTADATLWFFHAIHRYLEVTGDLSTLRLLLPVLKEIIHHHLKGTRFGIGMDPDDGLLKQGDPSFPLTWMDAKVGDLIVTPRRGKAVEINALWFNAVSLLHDWTNAEEGKKEEKHTRELLEKIHASFNRRFWYPKGGYLYDIIDGEIGEDPSVRPNQLFSISLTHPVLEQSRWRSVFDIVTTHLLTPVGLRTLSPDHPDYKSHYWGDLRARDAAYHQGTVWPWLLGAYVDVWLKVAPNGKKEAHEFLDAFLTRMSVSCAGTINEIFDAEEPYNPGGCISQAWSIAEVLRAWIKTAP
jgi:predicted glycogen debranching enzyme